MGLNLSSEKWEERSRTTAFEDRCDPEEAKDIAHRAERTGPDDRQQMTDGRRRCFHILNEGPAPHCNARRPFGLPFRYQRTCPA